MNKSKKNIQDQLNVMRKIEKNTNLSQRDLAAELGFSLGKINYCLKELRIKGFIKMNNFKKSKNKIKYAYVLTPGGIAAKTRLTINFMKNKMKEYDELKKEIID
jgi:EPS-associated MarR family transcriptional regulator|tara:strand:- start:560 stop:871 length:312 start_codon:yes stop_codon:yes gene_type:complete